MSLLFKNGTIVTASATYNADVFVVDGKIAEIGPTLSMAADEIVDLQGKYLLPGGVDVHTHLDAPVGVTTTADDFASGTAAGAVGGTTTIVDFAMQAKGSSLPATIEEWKAKAAGQAVVDYGLHIMVCDLYDGIESDLEDMVADGVTSFKVFMAFPTSFMIDDGQLLRVMGVGARTGAKICIHAENGYVIDHLAQKLVDDGHTSPSAFPLARPPATEVEAVNRAIVLAEIADAPIYFVHLSTEGAAEAVAEAQQRGLAVSGETCTHYLTLDNSMYQRPGFEAAKAVCAPPLRELQHQDAMWQALRTGSLGIVSSDHCPFCFQGQKDLGVDDFRSIPNGAPGIAERMILLYGDGVRGGRLEFQEFVKVSSTNPAKAFGMYPQKGEIAVGSDADLIVIDPNALTILSAKTQLSKVDYNLWEGREVPGRIELVFSRGELIATSGAYVGTPGRGRFLKRQVQTS